MAEVAEIEDGVVSIDCVAIFYEEGEGGEHYRKKNKLSCRVSRIEKRPCKVQRENLVSLPLTGVWDSRNSWPLRDWRARLDSLIKTRTGRAWKGFWSVCFSRFKELLLELISCWFDLTRGWTNVVYFSVNICEKFANYQNIKKKKNVDIWCTECLR